MSREDASTDPGERSFLGRARRRATGPRPRSPGDAAANPLLELSSVDMEVTFFHDRLEFRRRLGAKHGAIPYDRLQTVTMAERSWPTIHVSKQDDIFESSPFAVKKMRLTVRRRRHPVSFDFRSEPWERIQRALDIVQRGMDPSAE